MFVGEVRWATSGAGSSWKLSGGRALSAGPTKVSKKRQVRRPIRRRIGGVGVGQSSQPGLDAGQAQPARDRGRQEPCGDERRGDPGGGRVEHQDEHAGDRGDPDPARHLAVERRGLEATRRLGLRGGRPFEQAAMADVDPRQRPHDRVGHEPRLVGEEA